MLPPPQTPFLDLIVTDENQNISIPRPVVMMTVMIIVMMTVMNMVVVVVDLI